jgi:hypothetical protein
MLSYAWRAPAPSGSWWTESDRSIVTALEILDEIREAVEDG